MGKAVQKTRGLLHYELVHGQESRPLDFASIRKYAVVVMLQLVSFFAMNCPGFNVVRIRAGKGAFVFFFTISLFCTLRWYVRACKPLRCSIKSNYRGY